MGADGPPGPPAVIVGGGIVAVSVGVGVLVGPPGVSGAVWVTVGVTVWVGVFVGVFVIPGVTPPPVVIRPIWLPLNSVNQRLPSGPAVMPSGPLPAVMPAGETR